MQPIVYVVTVGGKNIQPHSDIFAENSAKAAQKAYELAINNHADIYKNRLDVKRDEIVESKTSRCCSFYQENQLVLFVSISEYRVR